MKLEEAIAKVVQEAMHEELEKEKKEASYLPQEAFSSCKARAIALSQNAVDRLQNLLALAIIKHREETHAEDHSQEKSLLTHPYVMSEEDVQLATTQSWWLS